MGQAIAKQKPIEGINRDVALNKLPPSQGRYLLNLERSINNSPTGVVGSNEGALTPVSANRLLNLAALVNADVHTIRAYESPKTFETYVWDHSGVNAHTIYRINRNLSLQVVYQGADLKLSADPVHAIRGAHLFFVNGIKYLTWVDGLNWQGFLDVETSIATNSFHVPYFQLGEFVQEQYWQLPTRPPMHCIQGEWVDLDINDPIQVDHENRMLDLTWQFRYKYIYTDNRESEWSPISSLYFIQRTEEQKDAKGLSRCIKLTFSAGHPQVEKIVLAYRNCNGNAYAETDPFDWLEFKRFSKYEECLDSTIQFWQRGIRDDATDGSLIYDDTTNDFIYNFCGEGECTHIDVNETNRTQNPCPITSYALGVVEQCLGLFNNIVDYDQVDCKLSEKFKLTITPPAVNACKIEYATVKVAVVIHNIIRGVNQPIFTYGNDAAHERKLFGGLMYRRLTTPFDDPAPYLQYFPDLQDGFIVYPEGDDNYAITKQWKDGTEYGAENDFGSGSKRREVSRFLDDGKTYIQYATLRVVKGTKGYLRLGGHRSRPSENYKDTSTTVIGILRNLAGYSAKIDINAANTDLYAREIYFDTCSGDVDTTARAFVVADLSSPYGDLANPYTATAVIGYLTDENKNAVPRAEVDYMGYARGGSFGSTITDHNGFYFASWAMNDLAVGAPNLKVRFMVEGPSCTKVIGHEGTIMQGGGSMPNVTNERDYKVDVVTDYENNYYATVRLRVRDCRGVAMPNVPLVLPGHKAAITNNAGLVSLPVRNRMIQYGHPWMEKAVLMQAASGYTLCGTTCNTCMPDFDINFQACFVTNPVIDILNNTGGNLIVELDPFFSISKGLKPAARYNFQLIFHDGTGRHTWVPDEVAVADMPSVQQMQGYGFATVGWQILGPLNLAPWFSHMSIVRTGNTAFTFMGQWAVNAVTFVDSTGKITSSANADKIRLSIQALIDRNSQQLASNMLYQWVGGDRLEIVSDDTGTIFPAGTGLLDFLIEGAVTVKTDATQTVPATQSYELIIPFDTRLKNLKEGALIELRRPNDCITEQPYFELCDTIDIVNGEPVVTSGILNTFDTYQIRRGIRWNNINHIFPFPFEHHSPSDFWGNRCDDRGRIFFKNIWAKQLHRGQTCYISDAMLDNGNRTGISTFRDTRVKEFKSQTRGDITAVYSMDKGVKILCEYGNFIAVIGDDIMRTGRDGIARATPADNFLVETNQAVSVYGLQYEDPTGCIFGQGWGMWVDSFKKALVFDDYQNATDITAGKMQGYFSSKLQYRESYNKAKTGFNRIRLVMGYDSISKDAYLTFWAKNWSDGYINNRPAEAINGNETFSISLLDQAIYDRSFTPECYGIMMSSYAGNVFFSFKNGLPWVHKEKNQPLFNQFYGTAVDQRMILVLNNEPDMIKLFVAMQEQTLHKYYIDKVTCIGTDSRNEQIFTMESEVPPGCYELRDNVYKASFLFNKLTPNVQMPLWKGEALRGSYAVISFVRDNSLNNSVIFKDDTKRVKYNELDNIFFIYAHVANSAYQTS